MLCIHDSMSIVRLFVASQFTLYLYFESTCKVELDPLSNDVVRAGLVPWNFF